MQILISFVLKSLSYIIIHYHTLPYPQNNRLDFRRLLGLVFDLRGDECGLIFPNSGWKSSLSKQRKLKFAPRIKLHHNTSYDSFKLVSTDLREANVDCVTLGQYMQPTRLHLKVMQLLRIRLFLSNVCYMFIPTSQSRRESGSTKLAQEKRWYVTNLKLETLIFNNRDSNYN